MPWESGLRWAAGRCGEADACEADIDCIGGRICNQAGQCQEPCEEDFRCPGPRVCDVRVVVRKGPFVLSMYCDAGRVCDGDAEQCVDACQADEDCGGDVICDVMNGVCVEPEVCESDDACIGDRVWRVL